MAQRTLFLTLWSILALAARAQQMTSLKLFPDTSVTFELARAQAARFTAVPEWVPAGRYWLMMVVRNESALSASCYLYMRPQFRTELYAFDADKGVWKQSCAGLEVGGTGRRSTALPLQVRPRSSDTFFIRIGSGPLRNTRVSIRAELEPAAAVDAREQKLFWGWLLTMAVMAAFFLYNGYIYFIFRDRTFLYYLLIVANGMVYITGVNRFFNLLTAQRVVRAAPVGKAIYFADLNTLLTDAAVIGVLTGFVLLGRQYLGLPQRLPRINKALSGALATLLLLIVTGNALTFYTAFFSDFWLSTVSNIVVLAIILILFVAALILYRQQYRPARYFLLANAFPLLVIALLALGLLINKQLDGGLLPLPNIALLSHAFAFAIALVARINLVNKELEQKRSELAQLAHQNEQLAGRNATIALENEHIRQLMATEKNEKSRLQSLLDANQRELASNAVHLQQKQELLNGLQRQVAQLGRGGQKSEEALQQIRSALQNNEHLYSEWERFKLHFEQVHPSFFSDLQARCPDLTPYEIRLSAYLHLNLSAKEIALLLNIAPESVYKAKTRLKKKLGEGRMDARTF